MIIYSGVRYFPFKVPSVQVVETVEYSFRAYVAGQKYHTVTQGRVVHNEKLVQVQKMCTNGNLGYEPGYYRSFVVAAWGCTLHMWGRHAGTHAFTRSREPDQFLGLYWVQRYPVEYARGYILRHSA